MTGFPRFAFDRVFVPDRVALARLLLLVISVPLVVAAHHRAAPPRPRGGRKALAGERSLEPISIGPPLATTDALFGDNVERKVSNPLAHLRAARSFLDRPRLAAIPDHCGVHSPPAMHSFCRCSSANP